MTLWLRLLSLTLLMAPVPALAQIAPSAAEIAAYRGLHAAAASGNTAEIEKLVKAGSPIEARDGHQRTPLHVAAHLKRNEAAALLMKLGADANALDAQKYDLVTIAAVADDVPMLKVALAGVKSSGGFMSAASPGVVSLFFRNDYYKDFESYIYAIADAMRYEYEVVAKAGLVLQIDCPDLGMGRHIQYADLSLPEFRKRAQLHVEALNHAVANIPAEQLRMHVCWGNYEGPHHRDVPMADSIDIVFSAKPNAISFEAANPRHAHEWVLFETVKLPDGKVLIPGVLESKSNFIEHPELIAQRIGRYANLVGRENVIAGSDCGYGTWVGQAAVDPQVVFAKLAAMAEGAAIASKQFWK